MAGRQIFNPDGFRNIEQDGKVVGYEFQFKAQYYRGVTLSIVRDIQVTVDGEKAAPEDIRFTVNGETFTLDEMTTVVDSDYRWEFGEFATVSVMKEGGLAKGSHHIAAYQKIVPSYMPFPMEMTNETDFEIC
ncbi:MAG: hypothetical protein HFI42_01705 [Lachnospiraceae bacterium]|nr:hypothetical protein [Lachnospiraceae bacterium]MCI9149202.1 hypothetical protein [Lachnospiraceae bacterium]